MPGFVFGHTMKILNIQTPETTKIQTMWLYHSVISPKDADGMANSVDTNQTAPKRP